MVIHLRALRLASVISVEDGGKDCTERLCLVSVPVCKDTSSCIGLMLFPHCLSTLMYLKKIFVYIFLPVVLWIIFYSSECPFLALVCFLKPLCLLTYVQNVNFHLKIFFLTFVINGGRWEGYNPKPQIVAAVRPRYSKTQRGRPQSPHCFTQT